MPVRRKSMALVERKGDRKLTVKRMPKQARAKCHVGMRREIEINLKGKSQRTKAGIEDSSTGDRQPQRAGLAMLAALSAKKQFFTNAKNQKYKTGKTLPRQEARRIPLYSCGKKLPVAKDQSCHEVQKNMMNRQ